MGTLKLTIIAPDPEANKISHILEPNISPTAIPNDPLLIAVKSATSSGKLVPVMWPLLRLPKQEAQLIKCLCL